MKETQLMVLLQWMNQRTLNIRNRWDQLLISKIEFLIWRVWFLHFKLRRTFLSVLWVSLVRFVISSVKLNLLVYTYQRWGPPKRSIYVHCKLEGLAGNSAMNCGPLSVTFWHNIPYMVNSFVFSFSTPVMINILCKMITILHEQ